MIVCPTCSSARFHFAGARDASIIGCEHCGSVWLCEDAFRAFAQARFSPSAWMLICAYDGLATPARRAQAMARSSKTRHSRGYRDIASATKRCPRCASALHPVRLASEVVSVCDSHGVLFQARTLRSLHNRLALIYAERGRLDVRGMSLPILVQQVSLILERLDRTVPIPAAV